MRKIGVLICLLVLFGMTVSVEAGNPLLPGCYVDAPATVNEGETFTATVSCNNLIAAYGFQYGTALTGQASTTSTTYIPGTFTTLAVGGVIVGKNTLADYAVSRQGVNTATGNFTLGSYTITANIGLTADGSTTIALQNFKMSTILGVPITGLVQASPNAVVTVRNINLALLSGSVTVISDGSVNGIKNVALGMDSVPYTQAAVGSDHYDFTLPNNTQYTSLSVAVTADMVSHLACSKNYTLADGANTASAKIGNITLKAGDVVSVSGDTAINIQDATAIGAQFGSSSPTGEVDVNEDGTVDIYDLVHIGRNYGATQGTCS